MPDTSRMSRLRARMGETGTDLVVIGPSSHMLWLAGLSPHGDERPVMLIVGREFAGVLMPALNADACRAQTDLPFFSWADAEGPDAALAELLHAVGIGSLPDPAVAIDETMRADFALLLLDAVPGARRSFLHETVGALRARKDGHEYEILKANALLNDEAMKAGFAALRTGVTETEVADVVRGFYAANGGRAEFAIIGFGENGAFPHHHSGERRLRPGDAVLIDIGGRKNGYPSDMTRVGTFGTVDTEFERVHAVLEDAVAAALAAARPGVPAKAVDKAARDVVEAAGYGPFFLHRTGHGLGIDIHEPPYITATADTILEEGNVFSIEPGIYLKERFGIRLEEIVILRAGGAEILSALPRRPFAIPA